MTKKRLAKVAKPQGQEECPKCGLLEVYGVGTYDPETEKVFLIGEACDVCDYRVMNG